MCDFHSLRRPRPPVDSLSPLQSSKNRSSSHERCLVDCGGVSDTGSCGCGGGGGAWKLDLRHFYAAVRHGIDTKLESRRKIKKVQLGLRLGLGAACVTCDF